MEQLVKFLFSSQKQVDIDAILIFKARDLLKLQHENVLGKLNINNCSSLREKFSICLKVIRDI